MPPNSRNRGLALLVCTLTFCRRVWDKNKSDWIRLIARVPPPARAVAACNIIVPSLKGQRALERAMND